MYMHVYVHVHTCTCTCTYMYMYNVYMYIYMYMHIMLSLWRPSLVSCPVCIPTHGQYSPVSQSHLQADCRGQSLCLGHPDKLQSQDPSQAVVLPEVWSEMVLNTASIKASKSEPTCMKTYSFSVATCTCTCIYMYCHARTVMHIYTQVHTTLLCRSTLRCL